MTPQPIYSREAEESLIGSIFINQELFKKIDLQPEDFYTIVYGDIWRTFQQIILEGGAIDVLTVKEKLDIDWAEATKFIANTPISFHAEHYAEIVREKARRRQLVRLANNMAKSAYDQDVELENVIPEYLTRLVNSARITNGATHISGALAELYDEIKERSLDPKDVWGIPTGFTQFDLKTGGFHPGEMTLLSGAPGMGKSILAIQMATEMSRHSPGAIYELEMGDTQTVRRSISKESRLKVRALRSGRVGDNDWNVLNKSITVMEKLPIFISDHTGWTTASMRADLARLKSQHNIQWFVVDYLSLLQDRYGSKESEREAYISKSLKIICKDLDLAGLVLQSMTKEQMTSDNPSITGMKGPASMAHDTDIAIYILKDGNNVRLHFVKHREDTPNEFVKLLWDKGFPAFKNVEVERTYRSPYKD